MNLARRVTHFKGTLVIGMIAMNNMMQRERARGYWFAMSTLAVTSSKIAPPNIIQPTTAIAQSREY